MTVRLPHTTQRVATLVELLCDRADGCCAERGFTFFRGDDVNDEWLRYGELHRAARQTAAEIRAIGCGVDNRSGNGPPRAIVLSPPGPSYLKALFGALYAGMIAVTAYPPRARRRDERLERVIEDSGATVALVDQTVLDRREQMVRSSPQLGKLTWINVDDLSASPASWIEPSVGPDATAILQYTSGSTSHPKGVCLTHRNLLTNLRMIYDGFEIAKYNDQWSVTWLPPYHDMGLIGGLFQVMYAGECSHVIPPASFVQNPIRWLRAISRYRASVSGGPNFAYDTCVDRISEDERASLDLSSWTLAFAGAEPIRARSLRRFADAFAPSGFKSTSFFPCYGLAEATLIVSGGPRNRELKLRRSSDPSAGVSVVATDAMVSCGRIAGHQQVRIVDPQTRRELPEGSVGEIWVAGDSVSPGYWNQDGVSKQVFGQRLDGSDFRFLRTGDLGFLDEGELYVSGRLKELIVVRGRNFQPADIEAAVAGSCELLVPNAAAAFEVETDEGVGLALVQEVQRHDNAQRAEIVQRIRARIVETFDLEPSRIVLIPKRALPKTSSGKVKRLETKQLYQQGELKDLTVETPSSPGAANSNETQPAEDGRGAEQISSWLVNRVAQQLSVEPSQIDVTRPLVQFGLDSVSAVQIASELESFTDRPIPATLFYDAPTIAAVAAKLCGDERAIEDPNSHRPRKRGGEIAIIGVACRLPGADDAAEFWELLRAGRHAIVDLPKGRAGCASRSAATRRAGWITDPDLFDAALFGIAPREARCMDPQHRLLLETSWRAIENAGIDPKRLSGSRTGAFVGISNRDYERLILRHRTELSTYAMTGNAASMAAHRLSFHLDLRGPSLAIDTACSSSLVAVHQAVRAIQVGDCESAIVAGVNLILSPEVSETLSDAEMLSPDAICKTFDARANGYVRGEGCVAMLLKPLDRAIEDRDPIHAIIRGSAVNQDGLTNGITAPSGDAQVRLYRHALSDASLSPADITLLEAHGTGTPLGDPIEVHSLCEVYGDSADNASRCHLGAVKANIGHLEAAAGLASLLKVILQLQHRQTVPQVNLQTANPHMDLSRSRITIPKQLATWHDPRPRMAAVSSFGFGGTNAHVILSESPWARDDVVSIGHSGARVTSSKVSGPACLVTLSAANAEALKKLAAAHARLIDHHSDLAAVAAATQQQKTSQRHRVAIVGHCTEMVGNRLRQFALGESSPAIRAGTARADRDLSIAFMFSGQGGQHVGMGHGLYHRSPTFRQWVDQCDQLLSDEFGYAVGPVIASSPQTNGAVAQILEGPGAQTGLFVLQLALAKTLISWGIRSSAVIGHSMGEYAAAVVAEVMQWQDALRLTAIRARRIAQLDSDGGMTVVFDSADAVRSHLRRLGEDLSIAAIDAPQHTVVSGTAASIQSLQQAMQRAGTETRPLRLQQAFHSRLMDPVLETIGRTVSGFSLESPRQRFVSTLTGTEVSEQLRSPDYWTQHTRQSVQFASGLETLGRLDLGVVVEIGPHCTLCTLGQLNDHVPLDYRPTLVRGDDDWGCILQALADLFCRGAEIRWEQLHSSRSSIILPGHPLDRRRYWIKEHAGRPQIAQRRSVPVVTTGMVVDRIARSRKESATPCESADRNLNLADFQQSMKRVDALIAGLMMNAISELSGADRDGQPIDPERLVRQGRVAERYLRLLRRICEILEQDGYLRVDDDRWVVDGIAAPSRAGLKQQIDRLQADTPQAALELRLVSRCGFALAPVLRGQLDPLTLLFPGGDSSDLKSLYRDSPIAQSSNRLVAEAARAIVDLQTELQPHRGGRLRVIEVGAGTGGTTAAVLPAIADRIESYGFTDASALLLADASHRLVNHDSIEFQQLDIELPAAQQGLDEGAYDVVIAANVLHATRDLRTTLAHVRRLLRPGGFLVALEGVRDQRFLDLVFGLTEGWWKFSDTDLRPTYPLISEGDWVKVLQSCGFDRPTRLAFPMGDAAVREFQAVLIAGAGDVHWYDDETESTDRPATRPAVATRRPAEEKRWIDAFQRSDPASRRSALEGYLRLSLATVLGHEPETVDLDQPVSNLGIDSLMAIQLKNRLETDLGLAVPMIAFLEGRTASQLIEMALETSRQAELRQPSEDSRSPSVEVPTHQEPVESDDRVLGPMSTGQLALWMIHGRAPESPAYNFAFAARTEGTIDKAALTTACEALVQRHPVLRTCYRLERGEPVRVLSARAAVAMAELDCAGWSEEDLIEWIRNESDRPFDLEQGPVIRFSLLRCDAGDVLSISMHHIAADLWSMDVLIQELTEFYTAAVEGQAVEPSTLPATYDDYVRWEQQLEQNEEGARLWEFWRDKLDGAPHTLALPTTHTRGPEQTFDGQSLQWTSSPEVVDGLRELAQAERTTLFTILLAAYQVFLSRICDQDDLLVGTVSASRGRSEWEGIVGYFLNHLVLRTRIEGSPTFREVLRGSQRELLQALENQAFPFARLVEKIRPVRDASRAPLVQTMFIWDKPRRLSGSQFSSGKAAGPLRLKPLLMEQRGAPFDLTLIVFELEDELRFAFRYNTNLFDHVAIETLADSFEALVEAVSTNPDLSVRSAPLLTPRQETAISRWNQTDIDFDPRMSAYPLLRRWVEQSPEAPAIASAAETLTYADAERRADCVARQLQAAAIGPGDVVGMLIPRSVEAIIAALGIWKAGAVYLPLDPEHPAQRLQAICDDALPAAVLVRGNDDASALNVACPIMDISSGGPGVEVANITEPIREIDPDGPAYLIYTSGSTGRPKGVVLPHRGVANLAVAQHHTFGITRQDRCLQFASLGFDASIFEMMMAFHAGACLFVLDPGVMRTTTQRLAAAIRDARVSVATLPPSVLAAIPADDLPELHTVISAGEVCSAALVQKWGTSRRVFNAYGPTETTVWATTQLCRPDGQDPSLGAPIANAGAYVLDSRWEPTPLGVPGELCLSGPGLAIEYKNMPDVTSNVFIPNALDDRFGATMYRTGDRARWTHDGQIEFLGRIDDQVKIDGHRIEPGEIASLIRQLPGIDDAVVKTFPSGTVDRLVAYVATTRDGRSPSADDGTEMIRRHLTDHLPCYMVPSQTIFLDQLPLTANGKVDGAQLPRPSWESTDGQRPPSAPTTATESELVEIWQQVLNVDRIGVHDNFFDLGGASLQALQAADLAAQRGYAVSAERMFQFQTIAQLAREIDATTNSPAVDSEQASRSFVRAPESVEPADASIAVPSATVSGADTSARQGGNLTMVIESIGMYLPPETRSTGEVVDGCRNRLDFPLEKMTGIASRHVAGRDEFSIDLARKAALDCLAHSRYSAAEIDQLIACNISRYDGPDFEISYEPSTASKLKQQIGAVSAVALDVCNACAGFFTALAIAQSQLLSGQARRVMVVSGEYITHLAKTAQLEINGFLDPRLACLTLGDAGVAVIVQLTDQGCGFQTLEMYTAGRHHDLCVAKATDQPHGGAIMLTDAIKASAVTLQHSVDHAHRVVDAHQWTADDVQHVIMHQTSTTTLDGAIEELNRHFGRPVCNRENTVNNLRQRGNTASTTHWVAVMDLIRAGRIQTGDKAVMAISGSGQTIGTALYQFDDLPERIRGAGGGADASGQRLAELRRNRFGVRIVATSVDHTGRDSERRFSEQWAVESAARAVDSCLRSAAWTKDDVEVLIHTGIYRDDFLSEPAVAAILAGVLKINDDVPLDGSKRTLAFDLADSARGTLTACDVIASMIRSGKISRGLVTASEVENNPDHWVKRGVAEIGSAIALEQTDDPEHGLGEIFFRSYPSSADALTASTGLSRGRPVLRVHQDQELAQILVHCVTACVEEFLRKRDANIRRYDRILVTLPVDSVAPSTVAEALGVPADRVMLPNVSGGEAFTSGLAILWSRLADSSTGPADATWLIVSAGAGIEVACVEYRHRS